VTRRRFEQLVEQTLQNLPEVFRKKLANVAIVVEDSPHEEAESREQLLGQFHGVPRTEKSIFYHALPDRIILYQKNIEAISACDEDVRREVRETLFHELGHYFGLSEEELRKLSK
jgi:predicted Zn-dependent protease with MMP-like domain